MDGVPVISQPAVMPGESFTYEYTLRNAGSHMYHSHFMAEHQVPMGLLGAFIVTDADANEPDADIDYTMILNDGPLGFTINGKGFPATEPIVAKQGQTDPGPLHERRAADPPDAPARHAAAGRLPRTAGRCATPHYEDTVLVAPGERIDVLIDATELGVWAFHCHILTHAEGPDGMFGMVTALIVQEPGS